MDKYSKAYFQKSADFILSKIDEKPEIAIVLGSSLGMMADLIDNPIQIEYKDIPNFLVATAPSHAGKMIFGKMHGKNVVFMSGRFHYYEGYEFEELVAPVRVLKCLGVKTLILTNAAGGVNENYTPGDIMMISDHIKLTGASPLRGKNFDKFGNRFFDASDMYTKVLRDKAKACAENINLNLHEGVYFFMTGPQFETPAEIRAIRILGGDAVGMSTVTEALTAAHCGMQLLAFSMITNMAAGVLNQPVTTDEVNVTASKFGDTFKDLLVEVIKEI